MRFSILPLALLTIATTVAADSAAIVAQLNIIIAATTKLTNVVTGFDAGIQGLGDVVPLLIDSTELLIDIKKATKVAQQSEALTLDGVIAIVGPTNTLVSGVQALLTALTNAKPKFDKLIIVTPVVLLNLKQQKAATTDLNNAIIAKVPADFQGLATNLVAPIYTAFDATLAVYSGKKH